MGWEQTIKLPDGWEIEQDGEWFYPVDEDGPISLRLLSRKDTPKWRKFLVAWEYANCDRKALELTGEMLGYSPGWMCGGLCEAITRASRMVARVGGRLRSRQAIAAIITAWKIANPLPTGYGCFRIAPDVDDDPAFNDLQEGPLGAYHLDKFPPIEL